MHGILVVVAALGGLMSLPNRYPDLHDRDGRLHRSFLLGAPSEQGEIAPAEPEAPACWSRTPDQTELKLSMRA